ncbi:CHAT domain-containing protein [Hypoxylon sp. FL1284]|nr:CHAT domain-containing protein [Hypoxylon sp. FL1284]
MAALDENMQRFEQSLGMTLEDHSEQSHLLHALAIGYRERYKHDSEMKQLDDMVGLAQETIGTITRRHPGYAKRLNDLIGQAIGRFESTEAISSVEEAIDNARDSLRGMCKDDPNRLGSLNTVASRIHYQYLYYKMIEDLRSVIQYIRDIIETSESGHAQCTKPRLVAINFRLGDRYLRHTLPDFVKAMQLSRDLFKLGVEPPLSPVVWLHEVGNILYRRYDMTAAAEDISESIGIARDVVERTSNDHPLHAERLNTLGTRLFTNYTHYGVTENLTEAISLARNALASTRDGRPNTSNNMDILGNFLHAKYTLTADIEVLDEAISLARSALTETPDTHPSYPERLHNLGTRLSSRYSNIQALADIDEAISVTWMAIDTSPVDHPARAAWLGSLGDHLAKRYARTQVSEDLEKAIYFTRESISLDLHDNRNHADQLDALGNRVFEKYIETQQVYYLEEAIQAGWNAIKTTPENHSDMAQRWSNLGIRIRHQYLRDGYVRDLDEAIETTRDGVKLTPEDHPHRAERLINLSTLLMDKYARYHQPSDLEQAKELLGVALTHDRSPVIKRLTAGRQLLSTFNVRQESDKAYKIAKQTTELILSLFSSSLRNKDRQYLLSQIVGLASESAAIALIAGKDCAEAIYLLEIGRGVLTSSLQDLRSDLRDLHTDYPHLADALRSLRRQLDSGPEKHDAEMADVSSSHLQTKMDKRHIASRQMTLLVNEIRSKPRFDRFLLPPSEEEIRDVACKGPIVIINVSSCRCDALIIEHSITRGLELPRLSIQDIEKRIQHVASRATLEWMWDCIIKVILDDLGFTGTLAENPWPRIWWIPTGPLAKFPLHAAGYHFKSGYDTALDRVVSSYSSSVKALVHSRKQLIERQPANQPKVALVSMKYTPGEGSLEHAENEIRVVYDICGSIGWPCIQPDPFYKEVSGAMNSCTVFHFAGHGDSKTKHPLESSLLLKDWKKKPFTVGDILDMRFNTQSPLLAYLSACGTGHNRDDDTIDENIHLMGAFQLGGFKNVIGTLWDVDDELCVEMARLFYGYLDYNGGGEGLISYGLSFATRKLRSKWVENQMSMQPCSSDHSKPTTVLSVRDIERTESNNAEKLLWVPYIHIGV